MVHIEKYKAAEARQAILHDERRHKNKDKHIDPPLTHKNYSLCAHPGGGVKYMRKRIKDVMGDRTVRKDAVTAISIIVTAPKTLLPEEYQAFFRSAYGFLVKDFGEENIISVQVHRDEPNATDHIHTKIAPICGDPPRLSAKNLITRQYLKQFHTRLQKHIEADFCHSVDIINGATPKKSLEIAEQKATTTRRKAETLQLAIEQYKTELEPLQTEYDTKNEYVKTMQKDFSVVGIKAHKDLLGKTKSYTVPAEIWDSQRITQAQKEAVDRATAVYEDMIKKHHNTADMQVALRKENFRMREEFECARIALERMTPSANNEFFKYYNAIKTRRAEERVKYQNAIVQKGTKDAFPDKRINVDK